MNALNIKLVLFVLLISLFVKSVAQKTSDTSYLDLFELSITELKNIEVVSASKQKERIEIAPATIYVISEDDIIKYGYQDLQEALKSVPSVYLSNPHSWVWGGQRGFLSNFSQTLLMINGREVNNLIAFEGFISRQFSTHNIKQIEILASPGSALYGANALAGIINIITKNADMDRTNMDVHIDIGSFNTKAVGLSFGEKFESGLKISGSGRIFSSDEEDFSKWTSNTEEFLPGWADKNMVANYENFGQYKNTSQAIPINLQLDYKGIYAGVYYYYNKQSHGMEKPNWDFTDSEDIRKFSQWYAGYEKNINEKIKLKIDYSKVYSRFWGKYYSDFWPTARLQNPGTAEYFNFTTWVPNSGLRQGHTFQMLEYDRNQALIFDATNGDSLYLQDYYSSFSGFLTDQGIIDSTNITKDDVHNYFSHVYTNKNSQGSQRDKLDIQFDYIFNNKNKIMIGYTFDYISYVGLVVTDAGTTFGSAYDISVDLSKRDDVYTSVKHGMFLQYQGEIVSNKLWLTLGARYDYQNHYKGNLNPRSGLVYKPVKKSTFKLLYGESFREPNVFELSGNPNIKPAKLRSYEFAWSQEAGDYLRNEFVIYNSKVTNFLGSVGSIIGDNISSVESQTVQGIENTFHYNQNRFSGFLGLTYIISAKQDAQDMTSGDDVNVNVLSIPNLKISGGIAYSLTKKSQISLLNHYIDSYKALGGSSGDIIPINSYNELSATFSLHEVKLDQDTKCNFYFTVKNLLNKEYYHPNIRLSGTEKFLQNSRYFTLRLVLKV